MEPQKSHFARILFVFATGFAAIARALATKQDGDSESMRKAFCAGVFALAAIGLLSVSPAARAGDMGNGSGAQRPVAAAIDIGRIHSVLQLTPEQERYWRPVETALHQLAHRQPQGESDGFVRRVSRRLVQIVLDSAAVERLAVAARPLIARLTDRQKQAAGQLAQEMGLGPVVLAALN